MATISQRISLEGAEEVKKQLDDIGEAGNQAFDGLGQAGAEAADGIAKVGESSATAATEIGKVDEQAKQAAESVKGLSLETVKTSAEIAKLGLEITKLGVEIGLAIARHRTLAQSLLHLVSGVSTAVRAVGLLAPELTAAGAAIAPVAAAVAGAVIGFEALEKAATKAASGYEKLNHSLQLLATTSGQSFNSLQRGQDLFTQMGLSAETFAETIRKVGETLRDLDVGGELKKSAEAADAAIQQVLQAEKALIEARVKESGFEPSLDQFVRLLEIERQLKGAASESAVAEKALAESREKSAAAAANNLGTLLTVVKQIEAGQKGLTFDGLAKAETIIKAVGVSLKEAADNGKNAGQTLVKFIANADKLTAIKVGAAFGLTEEMVDRIQRAGGELGIMDEAWKRIQSAGVLIPPESAQAFERMRGSIQEADAAWARLRRSVQSPLFAEQAAKISGDLNKIKAGALNLAAAMVETFTSSFAQLGQGFENTKREFVSIGRFATAMGQALVLVFTDPLQALELLRAGIARGIGWDAIVSGATAAWDWIKQKVAEGKQAVLDFAASLPSDIWSGLVSGATTAWDAITNGAAAAKQAILDFAASLPGDIWEAFKNAGVAAWDAIINKVKEFLGLKPTGGGAPAAGGAAPALAGGGLLRGRGTGTSDSNLAWLSRGEYIMPARAVRQPGVLAFLEALRRSGRIPSFAAGGAVGVASFGASGVRSLQDIETAINGLAQRIGDAFNLVARQDTLTSGINVILQSINNIATSTRDAFNLLTTGFDVILKAIGSAKGNAGGGLLRGRGTGTSDSNLAWVSRGEYITPAHAVRQPGVLAFLEALRRSGGNLRDVLDGMGRFALGGMVPRAIPAFATGGLAGGMSNVTIQFPGLPAITGLRASSEVVDQLHKAAALAQVRSGGRKPSRYS